MTGMLQLPIVITLSPRQLLVQEAVEVKVETRGPEETVRMPEMEAIVEMGGIRARGTSKGVVKIIIMEMEVVDQMVAAVIVITRGTIAVKVGSPVVETDLPGPRKLSQVSPAGIVVTCCMFWFALLLVLLLSTRLASCDYMLVKASNDDALLDVLPLACCRASSSMYM